MNKILIFSSLILILFLDCSSLSDNKVEFTKNFLGGKLDSISFDGSKYKAKVEPKNLAMYAAIAFRSERISQLDMLIFYLTLYSRLIGESLIKRKAFKQPNTKAKAANK